METDAPSMMPPASVHPPALVDPATDTALNHPGNLSLVYDGLAEVLGMALPELIELTRENHHAMFSL